MSSSLCASVLFRALHAERVPALADELGLADAHRLQADGARAGARSPRARE